MRAGGGRLAEGGHLAADGAARHRRRSSRGSRPAPTTTSPSPTKTRSCARAWRRSCAPASWWSGSSWHAGREPPPARDHARSAARRRREWATHLRQRAGGQRVRREPRCAVSAQPAGARARRSSTLAATRSWASPWRPACRRRDRHPPLLADAAHQARRRRREHTHRPARRHRAAPARGAPARLLLHHRPRPAHAAQRDEAAARDACSSSKEARERHAARDAPEEARRAPALAGRDDQRLRSSWRASRARARASRATRSTCSC